jgi:putative glutamine amidotransferase
LKKILFIALLITIVLSACSSNKNIRIALSKSVGTENYLLYGKWLKSIDNNIEIVNLYGLSFDESIAELDDCDGLVLTGGPDVHPDFYGMAFDSLRCSIDAYRDTLEFELIKNAEKKKMPMLAICRGMQILNVAHGGTLIVDIPEDTDSEIPHQVAGEDVFHPISIMENTLLHNLSESLFGNVNSNHHQAVKVLAKDFVISALSPDGIIEAFEFADKSKPFLIAVQWHPERLDQDSRFAIPLANAFIKEVKDYKLKSMAKK